MVFSSSNFHSLLTCPISALPIKHEPEWVLNIKSPQKKSGIKTKLSLLGENIIFSKSVGSIDEHSVDKYFEKVKEVEKIIPENKNYFIVTDFSEARTKDRKARNKYINYIRKNTRLQGVIYFFQLL